MGISVFDSTELQATLVLLKNLDKDVTKDIRAQTKKAATPIWTEAVTHRAATPLQTRVLVNTARVAVSDQNVTLQSARIGRALSGGGTPGILAAGTEFGALKEKQFGRRNKKGNVVWQAARKAIPELASLWVQTAVHRFYQAFEGGSN